MSMKAIEPARPRISNSKKRPYQSSASSTSPTSSAMWLIPTSRAIATDPTGRSIGGRDLQHRACLRTTDDPPSRDITAYLDHPLLVVEEDQIQREAHPERMDAPAA